jgi:hypothetical protein
VLSTQRPLEQIGKSAGQSALDLHCTQAPVLVLQSGDAIPPIVTPLQSESAVHVLLQLPLEHSCPMVQFAFDAHCTHVPPTQNGVDEYWHCESSLHGPTSSLPVLAAFV